MKALLTFLVVGAALVILSSIAVGVMISISNNRPNWLLIGAFTLDSLLLFVLAARALLGKNNGSPGPDSTTR